MDKCFSSSVCNILKVAENEMLNMHHPYVGSEHLLLSLLKNNNINKYCFKHNLTYKNFKKELLNTIGSSNKKSEVILYTPLLNLIIDKAYNMANDDDKEVDEYYLFKSLLNEEDGIAIRILDNMAINKNEILNEINKPKLLNELGINLNNNYKESVYLRDNEIKEIMQVLLRKNKNNPILIGKSGVGKSAIVYELANRIKEGKVPNKLKDYEIYLINTSTLVAGTKYRGEFESRVNNLIKEIINNKNIILFIDEIHTLVKTGASDGSIDAANILKPYLARGDIKVIGATTIEEYNNYIKKDSALNRRFTPVMINEPNLDQMNTILNKVKNNYEKYFNVKISKKVINNLIMLCDKYMPNICNPDKCLEILDTTCSKKAFDEENEITIDDIQNTILSRINYHFYDNDKLNSLFNELKNKYNEGEIRNIFNLLKSSDSKKYLIFDGVDYKNKVKIVKYIASKLDVNLISIDCKEYSDEYGVNKLLGNNFLFNYLSENPSSFIMFNNYNDSSRSLYNVINTMINSGYITNNSNDKLYLNNSVIFLLNNSENSIGFNNNLLIDA